MVASYPLPELRPTCHGLEAPGGGSRAQRSALSDQLGARPKRCNAASVTAGPGVVHLAAAAVLSGLGGGVGGAGLGGGNNGDLQRRQAGVRKGPQMENPKQRVERFNTNNCSG